MKIYLKNFVLSQLTVIFALAYFALAPNVWAITHSLLITENSSDSLTVTYDGSTIVPVEISPDHWQFTLPDLVHFGYGEGSFGAPDGGAIPEPEAVPPLGPWNNVFTSTTVANPCTNLVDVQSDSPTTNAYAVPLSDNVSGQVGYDCNNNPVYLTFHDSGDRSSVPNKIVLNYSLAPGANSAAIRPVANKPVLVMGVCTSLGVRGVGQVTLLHIASSFLEWTGLESPFSASITNGYSGTAGTHIVYIDYSHQVDIQVASPDTIRVHNGSGTMRTGNVTLVW